MSIYVSTREALRHTLYQAGAYGAVTWLRNRRGGDAGHLQRGGVRERFEAIYREGTWRHGEGGTPASGAGSSLAATATLRRRLPDVLDAIGAETLLDVGCGDFTWMREAPVTQRYVGVDIVASVVADNQAAFARADRTFLVRDAIRDTLPDADVVLCREILFHLAFADIAALLRNVLAKPRAYLILTSDRRTRFNADIPSGDFRLLNLEMRPFRLPPPAMVIDDSFVCADRIMGVWRAEDIPAF